MTRQTSQPGVLILESEPSARDAMQSIITMGGYKAYSAATASDFFQLLLDANPSCVILELSLPDSDGLTVIRELSQRSYQGRVILTSGLHLRVLEAAGQAACGFGLDFAGVLAKPFTPKALSDLLNCPRNPLSPPEDKPVPMTKAEVRHALAHGWIEPYFQPKLHTSSCRPWGVEALARIRHPQLGILAPSLFIDTAERSGLVSTLTLQMLDASLRWLRDCAMDDCQLALNISRNSTDADFARALRHLCSKYAVAPERITLEVTETARQVSELELLEFLTRFRIQGFHLSLDDFGIGYSTLAELARLPFSEVKIDKGFVSNLARSPMCQKICSGIIALARAIDMEVTAEGVDENEAFAFLEGIGCDKVQGYLLSRPLSAADAHEWLARAAKSPASPAGSHVGSGVNPPVHGTATPAQ